MGAKLELKSLVQNDKGFGDHPLGRMLLDGVEAALDTGLNAPDDRFEGWLQGKLAGMGASEFRQMLEQQTRPQIDMIQVNGALLGLLLGAAVGAVIVLTQHL